MALNESSSAGAVIIQKILQEQCRSLLNKGLSDSENMLLFPEKVLWSQQEL
jgi:hypothetical protein